MSSLVSPPTPNPSPGFVFLAVLGLLQMIDFDVTYGHTLHC